MRAARRFVSSRSVTHTHKVSLAEAGRTMGGPGRDMKITYTETARGGLAVNVIEC
ncbi:hypothetical protein [Streptomyces lydicus]|uniref:hypothetical protein n=1 Tax=Streptomyces lydicus TaxID=47763 RepID=UPI0037A9EA6A